MSSNMISEGIILIAVVITAATASQIFLGSLTDIEKSTEYRFDDLGDKVETSLEIIHAQKLSNTSIKFWIKNTGNKGYTYSELEKCDIMFGREGLSYDYYFLTDETPGWNATFETGDDNYWHKSETLCIHLNLDYELISGDYYLNFVTLHGVKNVYEFSIGD